MNSAVLALWPQRRLYWLLAGVALIALVGGLLGSGAMRGPHAREVAGPGGSTGTSGVSAATTGPTLALHLDGAGLAPPSGVVTFLATVAAGGAPLADLEASSSGVDQQWQTLATFTGTGPVAVATGFNITDPAYGGSTATGSRTVLVRVRDAAGGSASA
ncbi:MAG: hypothetical protein ACTHMR_23050, partial [Thermomicrobiales bacterium]